ncbi:MAG: MFS transporter [Candidatus Hodarchaeota archaeon]
MMIFLKRLDIISMDKKLWPVMISVGLWHLGYSLYGPFVSLWILRDLGHPSFFILAIMISLPGMASVIGISVLSRLADRRGKLRELLCLTAFAGSFQFLCLHFFAQSTLSFLIIALPLSMFTLAFYALAIALATNICDPEKKGQVSSFLLLFASLGWSIGSFASGRAFRYLGMRTVLLIAALFLILAGLISLKSSTKPISVMILHKFPANPAESSEKFSFGSLLRERQIQMLLLLASLVYFGTGAMFVLSTIYYVEGVGVLEDDFGYANAIATLIAIPVLLLIGRGMDALGRRVFLRLAVGIHLSWFVLVSLTQDPLLLLILWIIPLYAFLSPTLTAMMADLTELSQRARGMGLILTTMMLMPGLGAILGGLAADKLGTLFVLPLIALVFLPFALFLAFLISESQEKLIFHENPTIAPLSAQ